MLRNLRHLWRLIGDRALPGPAQRAVSAGAPAAAGPGAAPRAPAGRARTPRAGPDSAWRWRCRTSGPSFIKLGQSLATRSDLLGQELAADLSQLQDDLPPFDGALARR